MRFAPLLLLSSLLLVGCGQLPPGEFPNAGSDEAEQSDDYDDTDPSALTEFHSALDTHGAWVEDETYGTVWVPNRAEVGADFTPYVTAGHWTYDDDWVWVSDWEWGWAPFHYGRWVFVDARGWVWIPGRRYAGAWVVWQYDDTGGYVGWAAAPPYWYWRAGVATRIGFGVGIRYVYVSRGDVFYAGGLHQRVFWGDRAVGLRGSMRVVARPTPQSFGHVGPAPRSGGMGHVLPNNRSSVGGGGAGGSGVGHAVPNNHSGNSGGGFGHAVPSNRGGGGGGGFGHTVPSNRGGGGFGHAVPSRGGRR